MEELTLIVKAMWKMSWMVIFPAVVLFIATRDYKLEGNKK